MENLKIQVFQNLVLLKLNNTGQCIFQNLEIFFCIYFVILQYVPCAKL